MLFHVREHGREREGRLRRHQVREREDEGEKVHWLMCVTHCTQEDKRREEQDQREAAPGDFLQ